MRRLVLLLLGLVSPVVAQQPAGVPYINRWNTDAVETILPGVRTQLAHFGQRRVRFQQGMFDKFRKV